MPEGEIYIPPEGAMQFQITNHEAPGMDSNLVLRANVAKLPDVIWVEGPPEKNRRGTCSCATVWVVIIDSLPTEFRDLAKDRAKRANGHFTICTCQGKLIE